MAASLFALPDVVQLGMVTLANVVGHPTVVSHVGDSSVTGGPTVPVCNVKVPVSFPVFCPELGMVVGDNREQLTGYGATTG
jgi:hypothetical protein